MKLISIDDARQIIDDATKESNKFQYIGIGYVVGRILDEDIRAPFPMPLFDRSKMDGWALCGDSPDRKYRIKGTLQAGLVEESFEGDNTPLQKGECYKIMTGAPVILGADRVAEKEICTSGKDGLFVEAKTEKGRYIAFAGEDRKEGALLIPKGTELRAHHIALIASSGYNRVRVKERLDCSIFVTGNELREPDHSSLDNKRRTLFPGEIYNANGWAFQALCMENGIIPHYRGKIGDTLEQFVEKLEEGGTDPLIILSGGVSVGDYDFVGEALRRWGAQQLLYKVASKPGKPLLVCKKGQSLIFAFPGNPVSSMVGFREFLLPAVRKIYGMKNIYPETIKARFSGSYIRGDEREHFINMEIFSKDGEPWCSTVPSNSSGDMVSYASSQALLRVRKREINNGEWVELELIKPL